MLLFYLHSDGDFVGTTLSCYLDDASCIKINPRNFALVPRDEQPPRSTHRGLKSTAINQKPSHTVQPTIIPMETAVSLAWIFVYLVLSLPSSLGSDKPECRVPERYCRWIENSWTEGSTSRLPAIFGY